MDSAASAPAPVSARPGGLRALRALPVPVLLLVAAAAGFVLGGLTSFAQSSLPEAISSVANSSTGWTLATVLVVALLRARPAASALLATVCFLALVLGYQVVSTARGYPTSEVFFLIMSLLAGPFVGVATAWLRERGVRAALAAGLLGGIAIGEGVFGLALLLGSTSWFYWSAMVATGLVLVAVVCVRALDRLRDRLLCVAVTAAVAAAFVGAYAGAGGLMAVLPL